MAADATVVIAAYNRSRFITRAVRSALEQQGTSTDVVVVDDGSTDDTAAVAEAAGARVIRQDNRERGAARNAGAAAALGRHLIFLDSDDELGSRHAAPLVERLDAAPETGLVYRQAEFVDASGTVFFVAPNGVVSGDAAVASLLRSNEIAFSGTAIRRALFQRLGGFAEDRRMAGAEDLELWTRVAAMSRIEHVPGRTVRIHFHGQNSVADPQRLEAAIRYAWSVVTSDPSRSAQLPSARRQQAWLVRVLVRSYLATGDRAGARRLVAREAANSPRWLLEPAGLHALARALTAARSTP